MQCRIFFPMVTWFSIPTLNSICLSTAQADIFETQRSCSVQGNYLNSLRKTKINHWHKIDGCYKIMLVAKYSIRKQNGCNQLHILVYTSGSSSDASVVTRIDQYQKKKLFSSSSFWQKLVKVEPCGVSMPKHDSMDKISSVLMWK